MPSVEPASTLGLSISQYFDTGLYSDLRIRDSNGHEYAVHRVIVCGQSPVLANACNPEHGFKEAQTGIINLQNDDPGAVKAMLEFMYRGSYTTTEDGSTMLSVAHAHAIAEIYEISELKKLTVAQFEGLSSTGWESPDFANAMRVIYESVPESNKGGIRETAVGVAAHHYKALLEKPEFESVLDDFAALGKDILRALSKKSNHRKTPSKEAAINDQSYSYRNYGIYGDSDDSDDSDDS